MKTNLVTTFYHAQDEATPAPPKPAITPGGCVTLPFEPGWRWKTIADASGWTLFVYAHRFRFRGWRITSTRMERTCVT